MRRSKPLHRKSPMKRRRTKRKGEDREYLAWVHTLPCCASKAAPGEEVWCLGRIEADHAGPMSRKGMGLRSPDRDAIPLCTYHHNGSGGRHQFKGPFKYWDKWRMRAWLDARIAETQAEYTRLLAASGLEAPF